MTLPPHQGRVPAAVAALFLLRIHPGGGRLAK